VKSRRRMCCVWVSTVVLTGCSTSYAPRPSPRVAVVMQGGTPGYMREGRFYEGGGFGGDIDEAVRGNPEAESHAKAYRAGMIGGFAATMAGVASTIGGGMLYVGNAGEDASERDTTMQTAGGVLFLGGVAAYITGLVLFANAQPHLWDAINIYNDGVYDPGAPPRPYGPYGPQPPPAYGPNAPIAPPAPVAPPAR
jgi:hypothetical protein